MQFKIIDKTFIWLRNNPYGNSELLCANYEYTVVSLDENKITFTIPMIIRESSTKERLREMCMSKYNKILKEREFIKQEQSKMEEIKDMCIGDIL